MKVRSITFIIKSSFYSMLLASMVSSSLVFYLLYNNKVLDDNLSKSKIPLVGLATEISNLITISNNLTNNWILQPNIREKEELQEIIDITSKNISNNLLLIKDS